MRFKILIIATCLLLFSGFAFAGHYCLVENGQIVKGPRSLPTAWGNTSGLNHLDDAGLKARGWLPYVPGNPPGYDPDTQYLTFTNVVGEDAVTRSYTVNNYTQEQLDELAAEAARIQKIADAKTLIDSMSAVSELTYPQIETYVRNTFSGLSEDQQVALVRLYKIVLAIVKRNDWSK